MLKALMREANEFAVIGGRMNIANPQTDAEEFLGKYLIIGGEKKLDLTRLDYLGLDSNPLLRRIMLKSIEKCSLNCPASQMVMKAGPNIELEEALADLHGMETTITFSNGYALNQNIVRALGLRMKTPHLVHYARQGKMGRETKDVPTLYFVDEESHMSLQEGARQAKAHSRDMCQIFKFRSMDYNHLEDLLRRNGEDAVRVIISDALSSISGTVFDIEALCLLSEKYDALLYLDEAHAVGAIGPEGAGAASLFGNLKKYRERILLMATLAKTFCQVGGYVAMTSRDLMQYLRFCSPQYIFSNPIPPWMAKVLVKLIVEIRGEFGENARQRLKTVSDYTRNKLHSNGFNTLGSTTHIIPILVGSNEKAGMAKEYLLKKGFVVGSFRYPAVPHGTERIRISMCSDIEEHEIDRIVECLAEARNKINF